MYLFIFIRKKTIGTKYGTSNYAYFLLTLSDLRRTYPYLGIPTDI